MWVIFHNVDVLGGLDFTAALLVFALSNLAFSLADMFVGHLDQLPRYLRAGRSTPSTSGRSRCSPSS